MLNRFLFLLSLALLFCGLVLAQDVPPDPADPATWRFFWGSIPALVILVNLTVAAIRPLIPEKVFTYRGGLFGFLIAVATGVLLGLLGYFPLGWLIAEDAVAALIFGATAGVLAAGGWNMFWKYVLAFLASFRVRAEARKMEAQAAEKHADARLIEAHVSQAEAKSRGVV